MAIAKIEKYHGEPAIVVNGEAFPPMTVTLKIREPEYIRRLRESGIRIFYVETTTRWNQPGDEHTLDGITQTLHDMKLVLDAAPDAYIVLRLNVSPNVAWINAHPEEQVLFNDGKRKPVICTCAGMEPVDGMVSFASEAWKRDGKVALEEYFNEIDGNPMFERVIGYFLCAGGTGEWYYPGLTRMHDDETGDYADFSEPFRKYFGGFLRRKYGTEEELRRVWKRPDASFEHPLIPDMNDRTHIFEADKQISYGLKNWECSYSVGVNVNADAKAPANLGIFLNANGYCHTADFFDALHEATADMIVYFAEILKERHPELLVGAFYGYLGCTDYYDASHSTGTLKVLDSGKVDFMAGPGVYNNREPGGVVGQREMQDSFRIRNQIYISEDDSRTHRCMPLVQREAMALYTVEDSINTLKRDFARTLCEELQGWWFDMGGYGKTPCDWYDDPEILALFRRQQEVAEFNYSCDRTKKNEIAMIYDLESVHLASDVTDRLVLDYFRTSDLHRIGAPIDYYYHDDMKLPEMPDYKLYVMLNVYCLTDEEREAIHAKARKNHATVLWLYAPGFFNRKSAEVMDLSNMEKTVGMKLGMIDYTAFPFFKVDPTSNPAVELADPRRRYGYIDRVVHSNVWMLPTELPVPYMNPGFYIDDDSVTVLGRYCVDGRTAYAMKEMDGFVSAYCCTQVIRSELIASLAKTAGCHIYTTDDDVLYANENLLSIHAAYTGKRTIRFKKPCSPYEVYEKKSYGEQITELEVEMYIGETKMWALNGPCDSPES